MIQRQAATESEDALVDPASSAMESADESVMEGCQTLARFDFHFRTTYELYGLERSSEPLAVYGRVCIVHVQLALVRVCVENVQLALVPLCEQVR